MAYNIKPSKHVVRYLKKIKEKNLKEQFLTVIYDDIAVNPHSGEQKTGDLAGVWAKEFKYARTTYKIAYEIKDDNVIPILLCGTHENFYAQLKKIM